MRAGRGRAVSLYVLERLVLDRPQQPCLHALPASEPHRCRVAERSGLRSRGWRRAHAMQLRPPVLRWACAKTCPAARVVGGSRSMTWKITTSYLPAYTVALSATDWEHSVAASRGYSVYLSSTADRIAVYGSHCRANATVAALRLRTSVGTRARPPASACNPMDQRAPPHRPAKPRGPNRDGL